jgi:hypothetical protein
MILTEQQLQTLKTNILASIDQAVIDARQLRNDTELARLYNLPSNPAVIIWRSSVSQDEIMQNGFDWVRVDNLSVGKARIWEWLFANSQRSINPTRSNVRSGIAECWRGTAADLAVQAVVLGHCKRTATRAEALFVTGTGSDASPATPSFEGVIDIADVGAAMNLPE